MKKLRKQSVTCEIICLSFWCGFLRLKYYHVPRCRVCYVIIILVERRCTGCKNERSLLLENNIYLQRFNGITLCVIFVYAMPPAGIKNSERVKCVEYNLLLPSVSEQNGKMWHWKYKRKPDYYNKLQGRPRNWSQHPYIYSPIPKNLCKQGTTNINIIIKEQKMSSTALHPLSFIAALFLQLEPIKSSEAVFISNIEVAVWKWLDWTETTVATFKENIKWFHDIVSFSILSTKYMKILALFE